MSSSSSLHADVQGLKLQPWRSCFYGDPVDFRHRSTWERLEQQLAPPSSGDYTSFLVRSAVPVLRRFWTGSDWAGEHLSVRGDHTQWPAFPVEVLLWKQSAKDDKYRATAVDAPCIMVGTYRERWKWLKAHLPVSARSGWSGPPSSIGIKPFLESWKAKQAFFDGPDKEHWLLVVLDNGCFYERAEDTAPARAWTYGQTELVKGVTTGSITKYQLLYREVDPQHNQQYNLWVRKSHEPNSKPPALVVEGDVLVKVEVEEEESLQPIQRRRSKRIAAKNEAVELPSSFPPGVPSSQLWDRLYSSKWDELLNSPQNIGNRLFASEAGDWRVRGSSGDHVVVRWLHADAKRTASVSKLRDYIQACLQSAAFHSRLAIAQYTDEVQEQTPRLYKLFLFLELESIQQWRRVDRWTRQDDVKKKLGHWRWMTTWTQHGTLPSYWFGVCSSKTYVRSRQEVRELLLNLLTTHKPQKQEIDLSAWMVGDAYATLSPLPLPYCCGVFAIPRQDPCGYHADYRPLVRGLGSLVPLLDVASRAALNHPATLLETELSAFLVHAPHGSKPREAEIDPSLLANKDLKQRMEQTAERLADQTESPDVVDNLLNSMAKLTVQWMDRYEGATQQQARPPRVPRLFASAPPKQKHDEPAMYPRLFPEAPYIDPGLLEEETRTEPYIARSLLDEDPVVYPTFATETSDEQDWAWLVATVVALI